MGLDITAYSRLKHIGIHTEDYCEDDNHVNAFTYDCFPNSFRGIPILETQKTGNGQAFFEAGCYELTSETEVHGFRAGSYTGYNRWRDDLREQYNPDLATDGPFFELIWFADNEGSIGPEAAKDLLADFLDNAESYVAPEGWDGQKYTAWTHAFRLAADGGLVRFH